VSKIDKRVLVVILHYGLEVYTWNCVKSLLNCPYLDLLIVDNDPSQTLEVPPEFSLNVDLFKTGGLAGFASANNMGVTHGRKEIHDSVLMLNNDTVILENAIPALMRVLDSDDIGAVGPCMSYADAPAKIWACGGAINKFRLRISGTQKVKSDSPYDVDYLPGAAILCKFHVWDLVGGLPERYFLAYEEAEFALRIKALNYRVIVQPSARILHHVGMSSDIQPMYLYNAVRNRVRFSQYLFGIYFGFLYGFLITMLEITKSRRNFRLWFKAIKDEIQGRPLNRSALYLIKNLYSFNN
jgi:GT2 family glycosyltransferase